MLDFFYSNTPRGRARSRLNLQLCHFTLTCGLTYSKAQVGRVWHLIGTAPLCIIMSKFLDCIEIPCNFSGLLCTFGYTLPPRFHLLPEPDRHQLPLHLGGLAAYAAQSSRAEEGRETVKPIFCGASNRKLPVTLQQGGHMTMARLTSVVV